MVADLIALQHFLFYIPHLNELELIAINLFLHRYYMMFALLIQFAVDTQTYGLPSLLCVKLGDNCIQNFHLEIYSRIYGRKFSFTVTRERSSKT